MSQTWQIVPDPSPVFWKEWSVAELHYQAAPGRDATHGHLVVLLRRKGGGDSKLRLTCINARIEALQETCEVGAMIRDNRARQLELPPPCELVTVYYDGTEGRTVIACSDVVWERNAT